MNPMSVSCTDQEMQSWVLNRLPLSSQQKWNLLSELKQERHMTSEEIKARNAEPIQEDLEAIRRWEEREQRKREELNAPVPEEAPVATLQEDSSLLDP